MALLRLKHLFQCELSMSTDHFSTDTLETWFADQGLVYSATLLSIK